MFVLLEKTLINLRVRKPTFLTNHLRMKSIRKASAVWNDSLSSATAEELSLNSQPSPEKHLLSFMMKPHHEQSHISTLRGRSLHKAVQLCSGRITERCYRTRFVSVIFGEGVLVSHSLACLSASAMSVLEMSLRR